MATKSLWIGLGCQQGIAAAVIEQAIVRALADQSIIPRETSSAIDLVAGITTIQSKAQEPGILAVCAKYGWLLKLYGAEELAEVAVSYSSEVVQQVLGTGSVAEAAAKLASGQASPRRVYQINGHNDSDRLTSLRGAHPRT
jgi:cobalamin biosynthesis protein CbiG